MDEGERAMAFSDLMIEFEKSTDLMLKKFGRLDNKIFENVVKKAAEWRS